MTPATHHKDRCYRTALAIVRKSCAGRVSVAAVEQVYNDLLGFSKKHQDGGNCQLGGSASARRPGVSSTMSPAS